MKYVLRILAALVVIPVLALVAVWLWGMRPEHGHETAEVWIDRPAPQVFLWIQDDDRVKRWIGGLTEIRQVSAPPSGEVGKKFHLVAFYNGQRVPMDMTITKFEKDRALSAVVSSFDDRGNGFTETADYTLSEENGKTLLRFDVHTTYTGFILRLLEPMITPQAKKKLDEDFRRLKTLAEAEPGAPNPSL